MSENDGKVEVTLFGPLTYEGVQYNKGAKVRMSIANQKWYNDAVVAGRQAENDDPIAQALKPSPSK